MSKANNNSNSKTPHRTPRRIVCVETGEVYDGAEAAARALGIAYGGSNIRVAAGNGGMAKGYHWRFEDEPAVGPGEVRGNKAVVCWETEEIFGTAEEAAAWASCTPKAIYAAVRLRNTAGDYHWHLADSPRPDASALKFSKKVVCIETGVAFSSAKNAAESVKISEARIRDAIKRRCKAGGFHWHYEGEPAPVIEEKAEDSRNARSPKRAAMPRRPVICWETGEVFESIDAAGKATGVKGPSIAFAASKKRRSGGFHWYWADEPKPEAFEEPKRTGKPKPRKAVVCWETGEVFESAESAAAAVGIQAPSCVFNAVKRKGTCGGYHWYWANEPRPESFAPLKRGNGNGRPKRAVVCWETGEVYSCAQEAAEAVGLKSQSSICAAVRNRTSAGGYRWYYQDEPKPDEAELKKPRPHAQAVICWETGEVYPTITAAAAAMGTKSRTSIAQAAASGDMANGLHWYWADQPKPDVSRLKFTKKISRPVACWETGEVFENSAAAAAKVGVNSTNITEAIRRKNRSGGFHWYWADEPRTGASELKPTRKRKKSIEKQEEHAANAEPVQPAPGTASAEPIEPSQSIDEVPEAAVTGEKHHQEALSAPTRNTPEFENCVKWSVFFGDVVDDFGRRCAERSGLNATQTRLLLGFALFPSTPVGYVADILAIKRSAAGYALHALEEKGLVAHVEYRRIHPAELTIKGGLHLPTYFEALSGTIDKHLGHLSGPQRDDLLGLLGREKGNWEDALESWAGTFLESLGNVSAGTGNEATEIGSLVSSSLAFESICTFIALEKGHARRLGVPPSEMHALHLLAVSREPMKTTEICDRARLDNNLGTRSIATLQKKGLISCARRKSDRRVTDVALSSAGLELVEQTADDYVELFETSLPGMSSIAPESFGIVESS